MADLRGLEILVPRDEGEFLYAALARHAPHGWEEEDREDGLLARVYAPSENVARIVESGLLASASKSWILRPFTAPERDWLSAWKEFFTPVRAGRRFLILPPWLAGRNSPVRAGRRSVIVIEPKTAFGTGHHASTVLCLRAISDLADAGLIGPGRRFLDLGTGSGILGLGAALLGMRGLGVDPDPAAVENALENRHLNRVSGEDFQARLGSLEVVPEKDFGLILANILAEPLLEMAGEIAARLRPEGFLVLSGLLRSQAGKVVLEYRSQGLRLLKRLGRGEWAALLFAGNGTGAGRA